MSVLAEGPAGYRLLEEQNMKQDEQHRLQDEQDGLQDEQERL